MSSNKINLSLMLILGLLMAFTSLSTDIYLPAMPQMEVDLQGNVELTITGFLIGFTIAQLVWGAISDRIGRKIPLYIGMCLFIIGSIGCALSTTIGQIVFWRVFQALGACTAPMLSRAIVRDMFRATQAAQILSTLTLIMAVAPIVGPLLGGQLIRFSTWHSIFWLLAIIGAVMFFSLFALKETHHKEKRAATPLWAAFRTYINLLGNKVFMKYTLCVTFFYVAAYAFIAGSPKVYINDFGIEPQYYGYLFGLNIIGVMTLSFFNRKLVHQYSLDQLLKVSTLIAMLAGIALLIVALSGASSIVGIVITVFIMFSMNGIIAACSTAAALDGVPQVAGSASALIGALQYGSGIISSLILAWFADSSFITMAAIIAVSCMLCALMVWKK
ncbi:DHA1 family bicyclomycin/chloramphenicol resistance-like MFS transporter [Pasteurella langaaensis DSM 22999]|uniref:Bcr/CflA family efflux transporter n=1 Tax=Alitibacter langaaensis DSM 22999 TaxID=1122935 RepID=A0A2U0SQ48_9PAST|nr:multidrug effflux MFS transporter [Pasteurella langaaensis]PVX33462.1 DHA1 family bicyclomycin/chloramphenicol resistance-like MFS transporter [Pasteurella langaaensis DSM 22999]